MSEYLGLPGKKVTVLGLGISGYESALYLHKRGFQVRVSDGGTQEQVRSKIEALSAIGIATEMGAHDIAAILQSEWILISPGIPPTAAIYQTIVKAGIPILSEIEAASFFCPTKKIIAVTGTCGKTTVTTLLCRLLATGDHPGRVITCGNIGNPWIGEVDQVTEQDTVVLELSSFQLENTRFFKPAIGILLNLSPNHEDWHSSGEAYAKAKLKLFQAQTPSDYAIIRREDEEAYFSKQSFAAKKIYFGTRTGMNPNEEVLRVVAGIFDIPPSRVDEVVNAFQGIEHRLEVFHTADGVTYVNDSKSTTPASLAWALDKYAEGQVILIAGGHPKSTNFDSVHDFISRKVKKAFLIGEARELMSTAWTTATDVEQTATFQEAIVKAVQCAQSGNVVLLSPACASFDMFSHYQERGRLFKQGVLEALSARMSPSEGRPHVEGR